MTNHPQNPPTYALPDYQRDSAGKFLPGSGGRPKNSRNAVSRRAIAEIHTLSDAAMQGLKDNIAAKDQKAIQYVLDRILPAGRIVEIDATADGITEAIAEGALSISELKEIAAAIGSLKSLSELEQMREEMAELRRLLQG